MSATHFLTRTKEKVGTEMSLYMLGYDINRMIKIMGIGPLLAAMRIYGEALAVFLRVPMASIGSSLRFFAVLAIAQPNFTSGAQ